MFMCMKWKWVYIIDYDSAIICSDLYIRRENGHFHNERECTRATDESPSLAGTQFMLSAAAMMTSAYNV